MKRILPGLFLFALYGCSSSAPVDVARVTEQGCIGSAELPQNIASQFEVAEDMQLLNEALGEPEKGKLCQGQVYKSKKDTQVMIFRAWNSTNPNSQYGNWWAFNQPAGPISAYRSDYEICYQWSPLDKMVACTLKPETKVVVGNGQSARCSEYLTYPVSEKQQIYIVDAVDSVENCTFYEGVMSWQ
ncbi:hypothetical protein [Zobellella maritima]|uniref:hypothetical protein n=1 Tax=Zobellella maritima TaxID=2059725 RepID=UPI000E30A7F2|nr:hypothetical protein [Zobellella maritima]